MNLKFIIIIKYYIKYNKVYEIKYTKNIKGLEQVRMLKFYT